MLSSLFFAAVEVTAAQDYAEAANLMRSFAAHMHDGSEKDELLAAARAADSAHKLLEAHDHTLDRLRHLMG